MDFNFEKEIILENDRARLRPLAASDYDNLVDVASADKTLNQFSPSLLHNEELVKEYIDTAIHEREIKFRYPFIVFDKQFNSYAGSTSLANIVNKDKRLEIGWTWYGRQFQRTGLNRNCKFLLLSYAFDELGFERVELKTDERNKASRGAIEKIGGKLEGIFRSHVVMSDGFRRNTVYYSILKNEWMEMKKDFLKLDKG